MAKKKVSNPSTIVLNKKAKFDYFIESKWEAGMVLEGWEVKSLRAKKVQLVDSYVLLKNNECFLLGALITPLPTASTHINPEIKRTRKLLLKRKEINKIRGEIEKKGKTCVALALYWKKQHVKCEIAVVSGKKQHDKRATMRERDMSRELNNAFKQNNGIIKG